jgi:hypothetical protein
MLAADTPLPSLVSAHNTITNGGLEALETRAQPAENNATQNSAASKSNRFITSPPSRLKGDSGIL